MRKMSRLRLVGLIFTLFVFLIDYTTAQGNFEDADKLSDLMSGSSAQQFDLRHTIPGIPDVDYPIYSAVPRTSFECTGRHEGYYADIESRCQAFRICTHTARAVSGFGFLCPNGTLFSQKHFVCDWYRNVNCDDSERYYNKNEANRIGSSLDMMERVRQMMEYPMKTISKALQQSAGSSRKPTQRHRGGSRTNNVNQQSNGHDESAAQGVKTSNRSNSARTSVTRAQVESARGRGHTKFQNNEVDAAVSNAASLSGNSGGTSAAKQSTALTVDSSAAEEDVYVNSLGELSTDPGVHFDRTNAHIIAEPRRYRYEQNMNFAAKVNAALNDLVDVPAGEALAPDYVKQMRSTAQNEHAPIDLASNINGLLDEVANDLNPSSSGYQVQAPAKSKHSFRFLSRGFSSQDDPYKYKKPKQTASTIRFTPNQLPLADEKSTKQPAFEIAEDAAGFGQSSTTTTTLEPPLLGDALDYLAPPAESPAFEEFSYLAPPVEPESSPATDKPADDDEHITTTTPADAQVYTVTPSAVDLPPYAALVDTTTAAATTEALSQLETTTAATADVAQNLVAAQQLSLYQKVTEEAEDAPFDEDRLDVNEQAEKLFFSGLKLTANENETEATTLTAQTPLLIQVADDHSYLTAWITSTVPPTTTTTEELPTTTTEAPAAPAPVESGSLQERIRNYRRLASLQRASAKPVIFGKRGHLRMAPKLTTNASTTPKPTTTTRSYLKRVAASRLRLSRLAAAAAGNRNNNNNQLSATTVASLSPVDNAIDAAEKKFSIRNVDKETALAGNGIGAADEAKAKGTVTWESVRNSLQKFQVGANKATDEQPSKSTTPPTDDKAATSARSSSMRGKNRYSNLKMPASLRSRDGSSNSPTKAAVTTSVSHSISSSSSSSSSSALPLSFLRAHTSQPQNADSAHGSIVSNTASPLADNTNLNSNSASSTNSPTFISFDRLTQAIVDDSILQNYRAAQTLGRTSLNSATNAFQARPPTSSTYSTSATSSNAYQLSSRNAYNSQISSPKIAAPAPTQLTPPQRPAHLPVYHQPQDSAPSVPTTPGPRIVIARAEGQRIEPNSVSSIISSLLTQQQQKTPLKPTPATPYVPLDDFLTRKFGNQPPTKATYYQQPPPQSQQQQTRPSIAQQYQPQPHSSQYRQQHHYQQPITSLAPPQPTVPTIYAPQTQQQQQRIRFNQPAPNLQPLATQNIFASFQQQQQQQLPQFPPLATQAPPQSFQNYLNIQLPTLTNGLIPVPTAQIAQKRSDVNFDNSELTAFAPVRSVFSGATSYDVPLSSVGRLPNDIQALLRRLRRY